ncbi:hypothetical protein BHM03_00004838 [Ensete ventricosum]|uniref:Uncharacterized protein n=1 Tax=Ensete ventricosum TaxID=4639 RepID=A0A445MAT1_ENSVE|nr:hypothetical protein BHM03_00004838 [Ensete ventricosum]
MSAIFIVFVCTRLLCGCIRSTDSRATPLDLELRSEVDQVRRSSPETYRRLTWRPHQERSGATTSLDHGGDPTHTGNLTRVIHHPTLRDDPNILALEGGPMSQDRISNLFPSRVTEEAVPPTPNPVAMPQIATAPSTPQPRPTDGGQSTLTPDRYWRLFIDPGLTPPGHTSQVVTAEAFLRLAHQVQALTRMIQVIIPYIPQLAQTTTPLRPEPQRPPTN